MAHIQVFDGLDLDSPYLVEGLPGAGLVGKIAADHLVEQFEMRHVGNIHCDGLPKAAVYHGGDGDLMTPVRLYADEQRDMLVLQSDVPVSPSAAGEFAGCITAWLRERDATPIYLSGIPEEERDVPNLYGVSVGETAPLLEEAGLSPPPEGGLVSGPTGALLNRAIEVGYDALGLIVEAQANFPDPEGARVVLKDGIAPLTGIEVETADLVERAEEIQQAREQLARRLAETDAEDASSEAKPIRGFQ
jgi:uncharacterized protein